MRINNAGSGYLCVVDHAVCQWRHLSTALAPGHACADKCMWLQGVWASKFNERAMLSMKKVGLDFRDLRMAVLVQRVVPAAYAYVIHTQNPTNNNPNEVLPPSCASWPEKQGLAMRSPTPERRRE